MGVKSPATDLVSAGLCDDSFAHSGQQRTNHQDTATQFRATLDKRVALQIVEVQFVGLEGIIAVRQSVDLHTNVAEKLDEVVDIADVWDIANHHLLICQQRSTDDL